MSRSINNAYVKVPAGIDALELLSDTRALLREFDHFDRIQYQSGEPWICVYEGGILALKETTRIEAFKVLTRKLADEVVVVGGYSGVSSGSYGHFFEGEFGRFISRCEDWHESLGEPELWEAEIISSRRNFDLHSIFQIGDRLGLPGCRQYRDTWDFDLRIT
jgi:hypothetical protein